MRLALKIFLTMILAAEVVLTLFGARPVADRGLWAVWQTHTSEGQSTSTIYLAGTTRPDFPGMIMKDDPGMAMTPKDRCLIMTERLRHEHAAEVANINLRLPPGRTLAPYMAYDCRPYAEPTKERSSETIARDSAH